VVEGQREIEEILAKSAVEIDGLAADETLPVVATAEPGQG